MTHDITLTTEWKQIKFTFVGPYDDADMRIQFTNLAVTANQVYWFADCSLTRTVLPTAPRRKETPHRVADTSFILAHSRRWRSWIS